jgi:hypothetical protein
MVPLVRQAAQRMQEGWQAALPGPKVRWVCRVLCTAYILAWSQSLVVGWSCCNATGQGNWQGTQHSSMGRPKLLVHFRRVLMCSVSTSCPCTLR